MKGDEDGTNKRRKYWWIRKKEKKRKEKKREGKANKGEIEESDRERERQRGERNKKGYFPDILTIESRRFESKSRSMHCELRMGTKI